MAAIEPVRRFTPQEIVAKLDSQFEKARGSGDLLFFPSTVHKHTDVGVDVRSLPFPSLPQLEIAVSRRIVFWLAECSMIVFRAGVV